MTTVWSLVPSFLKLRMRSLIIGKVFRLVTRPAPPPAVQGDSLRVAIVHLIPYLGDSIMLFPLLEALRRDNPDIEISCFTFAGGRRLENHPAVDRHYTLSKEMVDRFARLGALGRIVAIWLWWRRELGGLAFDKCILLRGGVDPSGSAHLAWLLGGRERIGFSSAVEPEMKIYDLDQDGMLTHCLTRCEVHEIDRGSQVLLYANLLQRRVDLRQPVRSLCALAESEHGRAFRRRHTQLSGNYAIIAPGASDEYRCWSVERFASTAEREFSQRGWLTVFVPGPTEVDLCEAVAARIYGPSLVLAGVTDFIELVALCKNASAFLGNDSGLAHIAGACGVPTVIISPFGRQGRKTHHKSPHRSHPAGPLVEFVQPEHQLAPCDEICVQRRAHCILQVSVDDVSRVMNELLRRSDCRTDERELRSSAL